MGRRHRSVAPKSLKRTANINLATSYRNHRRHRSGEVPRCSAVASNVKRKREGETGGTQHFLLFTGGIRWPVRIYDPLTPQPRENQPTADAHAGLAVGDERPLPFLVPPGAAHLRTVAHCGRIVIWRCGNTERSRLWDGSGGVCHPLSLHICVSVMAEPQV